MDLKTTRQIALAWWNNLNRYSHESPISKESLFNKYFVNGHWFTPAMFFNELTGREIEQIFLKETSHIDPSDIKSAYAMQVKEGKPQFDEEQFTDLVLSMSEEQQIKAFDILTKIMLQQGFSREQIKTSVDYQL
jgi:hypothetical protein